MVTEADSLKRVRGVGALGDTGASNLGARPTRLKGMYRAAKRGEQWAVEILKHPKGSFGRLLAMYIRDLDLETRKESLFSKLSKQTAWVGGTFSVPLRWLK